MESCTNNEKKWLRLIARTPKIHCERLKEAEMFLEKSFFFSKIIFFYSFSLSRPPPTPTFLYKNSRYFVCWGKMIILQII